MPAQIERLTPALLTIASVDPRKCCTVWHDWALSHCAVGETSVKQYLTLLGGTLLLLSVGSAFGDTLVMHCIKTDCVRARCDDWRENCSPIGQFRRSNGAYSVPHSKQVCDEFGDCHFAGPRFPAIVSATPATGAAPTSK
jgi:hypothetical protein